MARYQGTTIENAIQAGLIDMDLKRDEVKVTTITKPKRGFLGIGKRLAEVELTFIKKSQPVDEKVSTQPNPILQDSEVQDKVDEVNAEPKYEVQKPQDSADENATQAQATHPKLNEKITAELKDYLDTVVKQLGITASSTVTVHHREVAIEFETEQEGLLIGKHGRTINALQTLAQVFLLHKEIAHTNVQLDVGNYRARRVETLQRLAESTAREVVATGDPVFLDPMPAFERKVIHAALADNHFVTTFSEGHEPHRYVVVALVQEDQL